MRYLPACLLFACTSSSDRGVSDLDDTADTASQADSVAVDLADTGSPDSATPRDTAIEDDGADTAASTDATAEPDTADSAIAPPAAYLTIAAIPPEMNGSRAAITPAGPLSFRLRVNRARLELDVLALPQSGPFTGSDLTLECTADGVPHPLPPASELAPGHLQVVIDPAHALPEGAAMVCSATIATSAGGTTSTLSFDAATLVPERDPFPTTDVWLVRLDRDVFSLEVTELPDGTTRLLSNHDPLGDGVDDFDAPFMELGVMPASDPAAAAVIRAHILRKVRQTVSAIYGLDPEGRPTQDGVDLRLYFEGDEGAPDPADFGRPDRRFSMIALTGDGDREDQLAGTFGRALIDWNNQDIEDDTAFGLGVWPAALARVILENPAGALLLADIRPALGGTPFGAMSGDEAFIGLDVDPGALPSAIRQRATRYNILIQFGSLAIAAILGHEIGHSLGLVPFGAPPQGLFAGVETDWTVTLAPDAHIDIAGLNVMQTVASVTWLEAATGELPRFEPLSWAYLRRQLVVGPR